MSVGWPNHAILGQWAFAVCRVLDVDCLYQVGSSLRSKDWRDVDVVAILDDDQFYSMFPQGGDALDWKWNGLCTAISCWGAKVTGLPIDFKIQPRTDANKRHPGDRSAIGLSAFSTSIPDSFLHRPPAQEEEKDA